MAHAVFEAPAGEAVRGEALACTKDGRKHLAVGVNVAAAAVPALPGRRQQRHIQALPVVLVPQFRGQRPLRAGSISPPHGRGPRVLLGSGQGGVHVPQVELLRKLAGHGAAVLRTSHPLHSRNVHGLASRRGQSALQVQLPIRLEAGNAAHCCLPHELQIAADQPLALDAGARDGVVLLCEEFDDVCVFGVAEEAHGPLTEGRHELGLRERPQLRGLLPEAPTPQSRGRGHAGIELSFMKSPQARLE
mmetsp:Transcript_101471/g.295689  ORF Transcript_101471/g.295689 Transcript_101471/m.295689 type:complete len:247 (-) Transcript_101471:403-1143(-)